MNTRTNRPLRKLAFAGWATLIVAAIGVGTSGAVASADAAESISNAAVAERSGTSRRGVELIRPADLDARPAWRTAVDGDLTADAPTIMRRRAVEVDVDLLQRTAFEFDPQVGERLDVELFPGVRVTAIVDESIVHGPDSAVLTGRLDRLAHGGFAIAMHGGAVAATFHAPALGAYQLRSREADDGSLVTIVRQVDGARYADCGCCIDGPPPVPDVVALMEAGILPPPWAHEGGDDEGGIAGGEGGVADTAEFIDLLVVYTTNARDEQGGTLAIQALILLAVAESNQAYANSNINPRLRLVGWKQTSFNEETMDTNAILDHMANPVSGTLDFIHGWRNDAAADLVKLLTNDTLISEDDVRLCGLAYTFSTSFTAFSITAAECAAGPGWTFAHEIGHNMGCKHDHAEGGDQFPIATYAYGHGFTGVSGDVHRTIMVRQSQPGSRIQNFSNPTVIFDLALTGVPIGLSNEAHNAQVHNERAFTVANFRQAMPTSVWVDFVSCLPPFQFGTVSNPFCTLQQGVNSVIWGGTLNLKPGTGSAGGITISKAMTITAPLGPATIQ